MTLPAPCARPPEPFVARPGFAELFGALPVAVIVIDPDDRIAHVNALAEQLLNRSERVICGQPLAAILPPPPTGDRREGHALAVYDTEITMPHGPRIRVDFVESTIPDHVGWRAITLHTAAGTRALGYLGARSASARAASGAAAMLAHEIKNPLSGIRGAAQLLDAGELTTLIVTEVDRIAALIDRMQDFSDTRSLPIQAENIYPLIAHARRLATAGFARGITLEERFDPSLPHAAINRDALLQVLINLLKNAAEATLSVRRPRIVITTAYRHGMSVAPSGGGPRIPLPIEICVIDNGPGAPADIAEYLFDPFISGRPEGQGLGLALVDKLMRDMGGIVQYAREGTPEMTTLRLLLPRAAA